MIFKLKINNFFFLIFAFFTLNLHANNIGVFNINTIYKNNDNFQNFITKIDKDKKIELDFLQNEKLLIEN